MNHEPVLTIGAITAVVVAFVALLQAFGVPIDDNQHAALVGFVGAVAPVVAALVARRRVTPVE